MLFAVVLLLQSPDLFKSGKLDGPTLHAVFYFTLKEEAAKALQDLGSAEPSVRLLAEYFRLGPDGILYKIDAPFFRHRVLLRT